MTDSSHSTDKPPSPDLPEGQPPIERRQGGEDRRGNRRQGKLDRRRNRCGACRFYGESDDNATREGLLIPQQAMCQQHQQVVNAKDFGCVLFEGI